MRRIALAALLSLTVLPGLAIAQAAPNPPPPGPGMMGGPGWRHDGRQPEDPAAFLMKFYAANTTHDGHLTLAQAKAADLGPIAGHFTEIDTKHLGYITPYDIEAWRLDNIATHLEQRASQLRAED
ncbi:hypothetical protein GCM10010909_09620 [Acidocella aquatica]|uniref:EF-hand domain-containing protein n=1 Tax=Acidocella aquatica TaxID=1922313 RepID=A0ABQ6A4R3_9PROT|nr:hypothetical protein [Acidocella aquatica]GLR66282.1 hypothetical protein GCM10010909_09620 [Acidocella aquatica]